MTLQRLLSVLRKAVQDYDMIQDGDKIALAVSGGKDSLALALGMKALSRFYPHPFTVKAYTVSIGFEDMDFTPIQNFMNQYEIPYEIIQTQIKEIVFDERKEENPCALCATLRKGALYTRIVEDGCNKVALGHHQEDVIETFMLSLLYEGRLNTFQPVTYLTKTGLSVIRPMIYVPEKEVIDFKNRMGIPSIKNTCPVDGSTKREDMKQLLKEWNQKDHLTTTRIFSAIANSKLEGWGSPQIIREPRRKKQEEQ